MRRTLYYALALLMFILLAASCRTIPVAGECPESQRIKCMTRKICQTDEKRGCQRCTCESTWHSDPYHAVKRAEGSEEP